MRKQNVPLSFLLHLDTKLCSGKPYRPSSHITLGHMDYFWA